MKHFIVLLVISIANIHIYASTIDARINKIMNTRYECNTPGAAIMILKGDSILMERYYGIADMTTGEKISHKTRFNIASISKQFTVVGALRLIEQGLISLDTPINIYFPNFSQPFWENINLWHLMSHTSGLPDSRNRSDREACIYATDSTSMSYFPNINQLLFTPGSNYDYKNPTFLLIAQIIEQLTNMSFIDYQQKYIFDRLGMSSTSYFNPEEAIPHTAHAYINVFADTKSSTDKDSEGRPTGFTNTQSSTWQEYDYEEETFFATRPDGGIYSTLRDLARWEKALRENTIISNHLLNTAYTPHITVTGSTWSSYQNRANTYYGLGWFIDKTPEYPTKIYHTGDNGGFQAYLAKYPEKNISIIILENRNDNDRWTLATSIDQILKEEGYI